MELWQHWEWVNFVESNDPAISDAILTNLGKVEKDET